jgi:hypothetical protein
MIIVKTLEIVKNQSLEDNKTENVLLRVNNRRNNFILMILN